MKSTKYALDKRIHVLLDRRTDDALKAEAQEKNLGKSAIIRLLLKQRYKQK